jgi:esterase/lipase
MRTVAGFLLSIFVVLILTLLLGVILMTPFSTFRPSSQSAVVEEVARATDLDSYLKKNESAIAKLRPGLEKAIIWNGEKGVKTPLSFIYLHGYSASRGETAPLMETVAMNLNANLFYSRFKAHGLADGEAFAHVTAQDWIDDAREAMAIGKRIGDQVVIVGMSTGALPAFQLVVEDQQSSDAKPGERSKTAALVLLSPNYRPANVLSRFLSGPLGRYLVPKFLGDYHSFSAENEAHAILWTPRTHVGGLFAMMDLVEQVAKMNLAKISVPTLTVFTSKDEVVNVALIRSRHAEIGASIKRIVDLPQATRHELAGNALAPEAVAPAAAVIEDFVRGLSR